MGDTVTSMNALFRDLYPQEGSRIKQWVVDSRREAAWVDETCPRFPVPEHEDNTGAVCRNSNEIVPWTHINNHDCCGDCNDFGESLLSRISVRGWLEDKTKRPPIESDHSKLSDEVQPAMSIAEHPFMKMVRRG